MPVISHNSRYGHSFKHIQVQSRRFPPHGCGCFFYGVPIPFGQTLSVPRSLHHIVGVEDFSAFFQIAAAHTSVFAYLIIAVIRQNKIGDSSFLC